VCDEQQVLLPVAQQVVPVAQQVAVAAEELQEELQEQPVVAQVLAAQRCLAEEMAVAGGDYLGGLAGASVAHTASHRSCGLQRSH
jgi:hypothetical protein